MSTSVAPLSPWRRSLGLGLGLAAVVTLILLAFAWPAVTSSIARLPLAIVGPEAAVTAVETAFDDTQPGVFEFTAVADRAAAVHLIEHREAYGAIVLGADPEVLTASAASTVVSSALNNVATALQSQAAGATVAVTDVVPLASTDPRGAGLTAAAFPLTLGGMLGGIIVSLMIVGAMRRVAAILGYSVIGAFALAAVMQGWFGALQGDYLANAAAIGLTILAISAPIVGLASLIGRAGIAFGPVVFLLFANPISSATTPMEALPGSWGAIGQFFPPGAGFTLLRDLSYFPNADNLGQSWAVVAIWAAAGLLLAVAGHFRRAFAPTPQAVADAFPAAA
ncbi:hypothetical protein HQQ81_07505 [Microbacteriaceae bacterium VKM Ac-2854]|nr:hypothetical protein [Microbacteriaceae bacterium VKM Ac-2854]